MQSSICKRFSVRVLKSREAGQASTSLPSLIVDMTKHGLNEDTNSGEIVIIGPEEQSFYGLIWQQLRFNCPLKSRQSARTVYVYESLKHFDNTDTNSRGLIGRSHLEESKCSFSLLRFAFERAVHHGSDCGTAIRDDAVLMGIATR